MKNAPKNSRSFLYVDEWRHTCYNGMSKRDYVFRMFFLAKTVKNFISLKLKLHYDIFYIWSTKL